MRRLQTSLLVLLAMTAIVAGCGGSGPASLSLEWSVEASEARAVQPSQTVKTYLRVHNDGDQAIESLTLRFDQTEGGRLPFGVNVGTVTNYSSRFQGAVQVWDLGRVSSGETVDFPITLWFEASLRTAAPVSVTLHMAAESPDLDGQILSNPIEVEVDSRQARNP